MTSASSRTSSVIVSFTGGRAYAVARDGPPPATDRVGAPSRSRRMAHRSPRFRRRRCPAGGHELVVSRSARDPSRLPATGGLPEGAALLRPLLGRGRSRRPRRALREPLPAPRGLLHRRVDAALHV